MDNFLNISGLEGYFFIITKVFFISLSFLYFVFALIVVKQINSMSKSITDKFNYILIVFSLIHLGFSILLILTMFGL